MCRTLILLVGFLFVLAVRAPSQASAKRAWGDLDAFRIRDIQNLQLSPLGDQLAFVVSERNVAKNQNYSSIWVLPTRGGRPSALTALKDMRPAPGGLQTVNVSRTSTRLEARWAFG